MSDADIDEFVDDLDLSDVRIEAWVGLNNKVLRNVRFLPIGESEGEGYVEMSLLLDSDNLDEIPIRFKVVVDGDVESGELVIDNTVNFTNQSNEFKMSVDFSSSSSFGTDVVMDLSFTSRALAEEPLYKAPGSSQSFIKYLQDQQNTEGSALGISTGVFQL